MKNGWSMRAIIAMAFVGVFLYIVAFNHGTGYEETLKNIVLIIVGYFFRSTQELQKRKTP